ncbi:hypothetical protein FXF61_02065 [Pseudomonas sp. C27(2019)]|uniref:putative metalloprotease CJM1_0395 family protein n=1 Tax=Pseudomonas sp. C27(2019) TaxID=2604941 RepID=UPI0012485F8E|nr:putative metalloprotease CJM1_0395 family protein [Pseudomonas sp. C27(2019)]QEY58040.1 hypothetical protein FXF61_02065 [Pseudomonas sp. C27(2019)]
MNISSVGHSFTAHSFANRPEQTEQTDTDKQDGKKLHGNAMLLPEQIKQVEQLKVRDREVRAHEMAHLAAAGGLATSGASYTYQLGPDGARYAVGGEVKIDTSSGNNPEETIRKAQAIRAAALAPAEPSGQDHAVAAQASQMEAQARAEQAAEGQNERQSEVENESENKEEPQADVEGASQQNSESQKAAVQQYQSVAAEFDNSSRLNLQA